MGAHPLQKRHGVARDRPVHGADRLGRQLFLVPLPGVPESLVRLDADGSVVENLTARAVEEMWVDISPEVLFVEIFG